MFFILENSQFEVVNFTGRQPNRAITIDEFFIIIDNNDRNHVLKIVGPNTINLINDKEIKKNVFLIFEEGSNPSLRVTPPERRLALEATFTAPWSSIFNFSEDRINILISPNSEMKTFYYEWWNIQQHKLSKILSILRWAQGLTLVLPSQSLPLSTCDIFEETRLVNQNSFFYRHDQPSITELKLSGDSQCRLVQRTRENHLHRYYFEHLSFKQDKNQNSIMVNRSNKINMIVDHCIFKNAASWNFDFSSLEESNLFFDHSEVASNQGMKLSANQTTLFYHEINQTVKNNIAMDGSQIDFLCYRTETNENASEAGLNEVHVQGTENKIFLQGQSIEALKITQSEAMIYKSWIHQMMAQNSRVVMQHVKSILKESSVNQDHFLYQLIENSFGFFCNLTWNVLHPKEIIHSLLNSHSKTMTLQCNFGQNISQAITLDQHQAHWSIEDVLQSKIAYSWGLQEKNKTSKINASQVVLESQAQASQFQSLEKIENNRVQEKHQTKAWNRRFQDHQESEDKSSLFLCKPNVKNVLYQLLHLRHNLIVHYPLNVESYRSQNIIRNDFEIEDILNFYQWAGGRITKNRAIQTLWNAILGDKIENQAMCASLVEQQNQNIKYIKGIFYRNQID